MAVCGDITANIALDCDNPVQAGTTDRLIVINKDDIDSVTYNVTTGAVEDITMKALKTGFVIDGQNNSIEPKATMVALTYTNMFDHECMAKGFDISPETKANINSMKDGRFVLITENYFRGTAGNAAFEVYGLGTGLEMTEIERDPNSEDTQGAFHFKWFTKKNKEAKLPATFYDTDYATTLALVDAVLV